MPGRVQMRWRYDEIRDYRDKNKMPSYLFPRACRLNWAVILEPCLFHVYSTIHLIFGAGPSYRFYVESCDFRLCPSSPGFYLNFIVFAWPISTRAMLPTRQSDHLCNACHGKLKLPYILVHTAIDILAVG